MSNLHNESNKSKPSKLYNRLNSLIAELLKTEIDEAIVDELGKQSEASIVTLIELLEKVKVVANKNETAQREASQEISNDLSALIRKIEEMEAYKQSDFNSPSEYLDAHFKQKNK